jgi:hypothetical protein
MYLFTAYVCENVTSFIGLGALLFGAALTSLIGLYSFVPNDIDRPNNSNNEHTATENREIKKWLKKVI